MNHHVFDFSVLVRVLGVLGDFKINPDGRLLVVFMHSAVHVVSAVVLDSHGLGFVDLWLIRSELH